MASHNMMTRLQSATSANDNNTVDGSNTTSQKPPGLVGSDPNTRPRTTRALRASTLNQGQPKEISNVRAKRGAEAVEVDVFSKPKRQRTASLLAVDMQAKSKLRSQTSKDEAMCVESEETSVFTDGSEQVVILAEKYRLTRLGLERAQDTGDSDSRPQPQSEQEQPSAINAVVGQPDSSPSVLAHPKGSNPRSRHASSRRGIAEEELISDIPRNPEPLKSGVTHEFYGNLETNKESARVLDEVSTYLGVTRQDISLADDDVKQHFATKTARLRSQLDFLLENIAAYCHDGTACKVEAWKEIGCPRFNGIPVLSDPLPLWVPIEEGPIRPRNVTSHKPTSHTNTDSHSKEPASPRPRHTVELPGSNSQNPILVDIDSDSGRSNESFGDLSWMPPSSVSVPHADPQAGDLAIALHGLTYAELDRLRDHCTKQVAHLEACFYSLCDGLGIPQPCSTSQIRGLGFTAQDLAHEFLLQFPTFCKPAQVSSSHAEAFLECVFSHHLSGQAFHGPLTTNPRGQRPTMYPTPETDASIEVTATSVEEEGQHPLPQMEEILFISNKKPRKGNRSTVKEPLFDYYLHEQRLIWQRNLSADSIVAAGDDRSKMQFLHCEGDVALSKQRERDIAAEAIETTQTKVKLLEDGPHEGTVKPSKERIAKEEGYHQWKPMPYDTREHEAERFRELADWAKVVDEPLSTHPPLKRKKRFRKKMRW